jgi:hypothetical protein
LAEGGIFAALFYLETDTKLVDILLRCVAHITQAGSDQWSELIHQVLGMDRLLL